MLVGNLHLVVGVEDGSVDGVGVIVNGHVVESLQPVTLKQLVAGRPVGIAWLQLVDKPPVSVRQLVEANVQHIV